MRRLTLASACFLLTAASPALAADVTAGPSMTSPGFDWTGYYAGLQAGYGWGQADIEGTSGPPFSTSSNPTGGFVGGYVGGLWQFNQAVVGGEAELNYASIGGSSSPGAGNSFGSDVRWFGSVDAKAGFAMDRVLIYGVGGLAFGGIETSQQAGSTAFSETRSKAGWTVGAGIDYALTDQFVVGAQYRYYDFGSEHFDGTNGFSDRDQSTNLNTVRLNLSYKF